MTIDENISFIKSQIDTFKRMLSNTECVVKAKEKRLFSVRIETDELRSRIRSLKQTLISDGRIPSIAALKERISVEEHIRLVQKVEDGFEECLDKFSDLSSEWKSIQERKSQLPEEVLPESDREKLAKLKYLFIEQLKKYDFSSVRPDSLDISEDSYKPTREGFNLGFDLSASDNIRTIWAYLHALLELSREVKTNHLGLLILDEPSQQETAEISFADFLKRASTAKKYSQQVLFETSEIETNLLKTLSNIPHNYINLVGKIVKRFDS